MESQHSVSFDGKFMQPGALVESPNPMMPLLDAVGTRRTSRSYASEPVDIDTFRWLIRHAMHAPTACNEQQWKVIYIDDAETIGDLYERGSASFLKGIQQCMLVCYNRRTDNLEWLDHVQSGAALITTFQLLAHSIGVGSCWIGHLPNKSELRRLFGIHSAYDPVALVSFGYYRNKVRVMPRKHEPARLIMHNRFESDGLVLESRRRTVFRTVARYVYYKLPPFARRLLKPYTARFEKKFYSEVFD